MFRHTVLIIIYVTVGIVRIVECIDPDHTFTRKLFGKSMRKVELITRTVTIVIKSGGNSKLFKLVVAVYALATLDGVLVVGVYITTNCANTPLLIKTVAIVVSVFAITLNFFSENKIQISEMLALYYAIGNTDGDSVFTLYEVKGQTGHVSTEQEVVVTNFPYFVNNCPTVGVVDNLLVCSTFVNYELSTANLLVLHSIVNCYIVQTSFFNIECEGDGVASVLVRAVNVRIRKLTGA